MLEAFGINAVTMTAFAIAVVVGLVIRGSK
jgi:hypothetical protein